METLRVIRTLRWLEYHQERYLGQEYVAVDCETTGVTKESEIIGISVCADLEEALYIVLAEWDKEQQKLVRLETCEGIVEFLCSLQGRSLIMHNGVFDCMMILNNFGINLMPDLHTDTLMLAHLLDENRHNGLKELSVSLFGEDSTKEQIEMKESVAKNGGQLTKANYELYKADSELIAKYGAKDALLTLKLFYALVPELFDQGLDKFFYEDETMPLLRGPTFDLNSTGLKVDSVALATLKQELIADCEQANAIIQREVTALVKDRYPEGDFNIGSSKQLSWLLFDRLGNYFGTLTKGGKDLCKKLGINVPYTNAAKRTFIHLVNQERTREGPDTKIREYWHYTQCNKEVLAKFAGKYRFIAKYLEWAKNKKLLNTYVEGIESRMTYGVIRPNFLQHGTTSGRYSCKNPNFQNLPRGDNRVKGCIVARPGKVFVGADYSQLEPRVFASFSEDKRLLDCFKNGDDFYSIIGKEVFEKFDCSLKKDEENSFAKKYPDLRDIAKVVALSATYGTTAFKMAPAIKKTPEEAEDVILSYFYKFPNVKKMMVESHNMAKKTGRVENLFGRPRRMPAAMTIPMNKNHADLKYEQRNVLNLAVNHRIQSTGASIMNRAAIAVWHAIKGTSAKIVLQVHDELILECDEKDGPEIAAILKDCMENAVHLPGVNLIAEPKIAKNLKDLK